MVGVIITLSVAWTYTYDTDTPLGTDAPSVIDDEIREVKDSIQERENVDHYWSKTGSEVSDSDTGKHRQVTFRAPLSSDPSSIDEDEGRLYTKDVSSKAELHWIDEDENVQQITSGGSLNIISSDLVGTLSNDTYFTTVNNAGDGTVNLIKADTNDVAVLPDNSQTATSSAPTSTTGIANKQYVDDQVDTHNMTPATYAAEESITFSNGFILKHGYVDETTGGTTTITFGTAFPTSAISAQLTIKKAAPTTTSQVISNLTTSAITIKQTDGHGGWYWQAWGY